MKRPLLTIAAGVLIAAIFPGPGNATGPFQQKLSPDQRIVQALNRMTFGPRPGDIEAVRRIGLNKWIELQLHPGNIRENPLLEARLKPLQTLRMNIPDIVRDYTPQPNLAPAVPPFQQLNALLSGEDLRKVLTGTAEERTAVLKSLDAEKRREILGALPANVAAYTPEFRQEIEEAQKARREQLRLEARRRNPPLTDLLRADQIRAVRSGDREELAALLASLDPLKRAQVAWQLPPASLSGFPEVRRQAQRQRTPRLLASEDAKDAKVFRAVYSNRQLEEVLVDFWINHFNVDAGKNVAQTPNLVHLLIGGYERDAIRPHVLGHFKDLLLAAARHPAMLLYLDNWESVAPDAFEAGPFAPNRGFVNGVPNQLIPSPLARQAHGINENYGREVMELHTLGVKGGYTQADVIAVARCFTGWTIRSREDPEFVFAPFMHDFGEKTVLGHAIPAGSGEQDGLQVIDILAHHPSTAKFVSRELAQRFVADNPPERLVDRMARTFVKTDGDLRAVLQTMFASPEFFSEGAYQSKIKSPFEMAVSTVRAMDAEVTDAYALVQRIADMGQPLYGKPEPTGYPNTGDPWLSTAGLMGRMNFGAALASGRIPGVKIDASRLAGKDEPAIARALLGHDPSPRTLAAMEAGLRGKQPPSAFVASLVLGSPDFQRR